MYARALALALACALLAPTAAPANPWNGKVVFQAFWWDLENQNYPQGWYTYLAKLAPRLRELGVDGMWIPSPAKGASGGFSMGYDPFDHYDLGDKDQRGTLATKFGTKDELLRLIAVAHANGLDVYPDIVLNHMNGGEEDPEAAGNRFKRFQYQGFAGSERGRWPKSRNDFHPNGGHECTDGEICGEFFGGPDICYLDPEHGGGGGGLYMRDQARAWMVWLTRQLDADGYRFDAVKHLPAYVVEDVLFHAKDGGIEFFCAGEYVVGKGEKEPIDQWAAATQNRCGTFDFSYRSALLEMIGANGFFDLGSLPNFQQGSRLKTVPFINSHDTWRGPLHNSNSGSELLPTIDPDDPRADVAYAAAFAIDGSPVVYYEDLIVNSGADRLRQDPDNLRLRDYLVNLIWAHQKLDFKDGAYRVPFQGSPDLLVLERAGKALIALNDNGIAAESALVPTSFGPNVRLHDYSGSNAADVTTDGQGRVTISVPPMSYAIFAPAGFGGGFDPPNGAPSRSSSSPTIWAMVARARSATAAGSGRRSSGPPARSGRRRARRSRWRCSPTARARWKCACSILIRRARRAPPRDSHDARGAASNTTPLTLEFTAEREGYHQLSARLAAADAAPTRAYVKVEYEAPAKSEKF